MVTSQPSRFYDQFQPSLRIGSHAGFGNRLRTPQAESGGFSWCQAGQVGASQAGVQTQLVDKAVTRYWAKSSYSALWSADSNCVDATVLQIHKRLQTWNSTSLIDCRFFSHSAASITTPTFFFIVNVNRREETSGDHFSPPHMCSPRSSMSPYTVGWSDFEK